ncbi:MAG: hypothetical protein ACFFG0_21565, partial [Candidatus Thorarchaeota archaeon]
GWTHYHKQQYGDAVKIGEQTYLLSKDLKLIPESFEALLLKSTILFIGENEKAFELLLESEKLINKIDKESSSNYLRQKGYFLYLKSQCYLNKGDFHSALESAKQSLVLRKKLG